MALPGHARNTAIFDSSSPSAIRVVDPVQQPEWDALLAGHPQASVFHGAGWARVLKQTYGHQPVYICRFDGPKLVGLLPVMEVSSPVTGRRGVSLPFTDFCRAITSVPQDGAKLHETAVECGRKRGWKYLECRWANDGWAKSTPSLSFYGHVIDLTPGEKVLFQRLDSAVGRGVRKAEAAGLQASFSASPETMKEYYALHCRTRRRHGLPPQPFRFFDNIQREILDKGQGFVATVRLKEQPLAGSVFFCQGGQALYKFGASDYAYQQLRPNNLMMWSAIQHCAARGLASLHLGRTSLAHEGLRRFKLSFGAIEESMQYCKYDFSAEKFVVDTDRADGWFNHVFARLPLPLLRLAGAILYPNLS